MADIKNVFENDADVPAELKLLSRTNPGDTPINSEAVGFPIILTSDAGDVALTVILSVYVPGAM